MKFIVEADSVAELIEALRQLIALHDKPVAPAPSNVQSVRDLELLVRTENCLKSAGIRTVDQLVQRSAIDILRIKNLGRRGLADIQKRLDANGLSLSGKPYAIQEQEQG